MTTADSLTGAFAGLPTALSCAGCGHRSPAGEPAPLSCPRAHPGDDIDHVVTRTLDAARLAFPRGTEASPFARYRQLFQNIGKVDLDWADLLTASTADTGRDAALPAETEIFVLKAEAQADSPIRTEILSARHQPVITEETVVPDPLPPAFATQSRLIDNIVAGTGRADSRTGATRQTMPGHFRPEGVIRTL